MKGFKNILWDFDGVILDSMPIRDLGFVKIFNQFNKSEVDELLKFHRENGGLSRFVKIKYFFNQIRKEEVSEEVILDYAAKFSIVMRQLLIDPTLLIQDSLQYIKDNYNEFNFHIVSGSEQEELRFLCQELEIDKYFKSIHGSPTSKEQLVRNVIENNNYLKESTLLIGDSYNDLEAAKKNEIRFYGYNNINLMNLENYVHSFKCFLT